MDLEKRIETLEKKVVILEETLRTLNNMHLSDQINQYLNKKAKTIRFIDLVNSLSEDVKVDFEKERRAAETLSIAKEIVDKKIKQSLMDKEIDFFDCQTDLTYFNYEIESGEENWSTPKKIDILSKWVGKGIRITSYNGFDETRVIIPDEIDGYPVTSIDINVFTNTDISEIILPKSLKAIMYRAFSGCKNLKKIHLPDSLEYLGWCCFEESSLVDFNCPPHLKTIPYSCFRNCKELSHINLNDEMLFLEQYCLEGTLIDKLILPSSVREVSQEIFKASYTSCYVRSNPVICAFLGRETSIQEGRKLLHVKIIYCLPGSEIQQIARKTGIEIRPLSEFSQEV